MKKQLIKLGNTNPELQKHIAVILDAIEGRGKSASKDLHDTLDFTFYEQKAIYLKKLKSLLESQAGNFVSSNLPGVFVKQLDLTTDRNGDYEVSIFLVDRNGSSAGVGDLSVLGRNWEITYMTSAIVATATFRA